MTVIYITFPPCITASVRARADPVLPSRIHRAARAATPTGRGEAWVHLFGVKGPAFRRLRRYSQTHFFVRLLLLVMTRIGSWSSSQIADKMPPNFRQACGKRTTWTPCAKPLSRLSVSQAEVPTPSFAKHRAKSSLPKSSPPRTPFISQRHRRL